jgi:uncharacterized membrane protein YfcA
MIAAATSTERMGEIAIALVTGIIMPTVMMIFRRRYEQRPAEWEAVIGWCALVVVGAVAGVLVGTLFGPADHLLEELVVLLVMMFLWLSAFVAAVAAYTAFEEVRQPPPRQED